MRSRSAIQNHMKHRGLFLGLVLLAGACGDSGSSPARNQSQSGDLGPGDLGCMPDCTGLACGRDPVCGESCGTCDPGLVCDEGQCQEESCQPNCDGRECGPDPECGESCGACATGVCTEEGLCSTFGAECDLPSQEPCEAGQKCSNQLGNPPRCVQEGTVAVDASCDPTADDCIRGSFCLANAAGDSGPICTPYCAADQDCPSNSACFFDGNGANLCSPVCDPFDSTACGSDATCVSLPDASDLIHVCAINAADVGVLAVGASCPSDALTLACQRGTACLSLDGVAFNCLPLCDQTNPCPNGETCIPYFDSNNVPLPRGQGACQICIPDCSGRSCGLDPLCGQSCGDCGPGQVCQGNVTCCTQDCAGRACGNDPVCGSSCGTCPMGLTCQPDGSCCTPDCSGRACGVDPVCGLSCGTCAMGQTCQPDGTCCTPDCTGRTCGADPVCGTSCGTCATGQVCGADGSCCTPDCTGRSCGPDPVCGASCGSCGANERCTAAGTCECVPDCTGRTCGLDPVCGTSCGTCASGQVCNSGSCCTPSCTGRSCGLDPVCGTSCGTCPTNEICNASGSCVNCVPQFLTCSSTAECCQGSVTNGAFECISNRCELCANFNVTCAPGGLCCGALFCNPANICNTRNCSELGQSCINSSDCCGTTICDTQAGFTCQSCRGNNVACTRDTQCCSGLTCTGGACR